MKFTSINRRYNLASKDTQRDQYGRAYGSNPGLRADFTGPAKICDTVEQQQRKGWTEEVRLEVERYLLSHPDFRMTTTRDGGGTADTQIGNILVPTLDLASGESVPEEHHEFVKRQRWYQIEMELLGAPATSEPEEITANTCIWVGPNPEIPEETIGCTRGTLKNQSYCAVHLKQLAASR